LLVNYFYNSLLSFEDANLANPPKTMKTDAFLQF